MRKSPFIQTLGRTALATVWVGVSLPGLAWAEEAAGHHNPWMPLVFQAVNLAVLLAILFYFLRAPIQSFLADAARRLKEGLDETRREEAETKALLETERRNVSNLDAEMKKMKSDVEVEAQKERDRLTAETQEMAERLKAQVRSQLDMERNKAMESLRHELADETIRLSEKLIKDQMDQQKQKKLLDDHLKRQEGRG
ncbi:MAG: ATP synthase F0 subunit B [Deltaproteobacteria bacterium]|nr:ATP synthase F0 subunit B [Deltaproteobacteria bacterium]